MKDFYTDYKSVRTILRIGIANAKATPKSTIQPFWALYPITQTIAPTIIIIIINLTSSKISSAILITQLGFSADKNMIPVHRIFLLSVKSWVGMEVIHLANGMVID